MKFPLPRNWKIVVSVVATLILVPGAGYGLMKLNMLPQFWPFDALVSGRQAEKTPSHKDGESKIREGHAKGNEKDAAAPGHANLHVADEEKHGGETKEIHDQPSTVEEGSSIALPAISALQKAVRKLLITQTDSAYGHLSVGGTQREVMEQIQTELRSLDASAATQRDVEAIAIYLLSGGSPRGLGKLIDDLNLNSQFRQIIKGARAYANGDLETARKELSGVDATHLPPLLEARLLLAQAALAAEESPVLQRKHLQRAASILPGTLVEEAASRRLLALSLRQGDRKAFSAGADRYLRRYRHSLYIDDFVATFVEGVIAFESRDMAWDRPRLRRLLLSLPAKKTEQAVLGIAQKAAMAGLRDLCVFVGAPDFRSMLTDASSLERIRLYTAACDVVENPTLALQQLSELRAEMLDEQDASMQADAMRMAAAMLGQSGSSDFSSFQGPERPDAKTAELLVSAAQQLAVSGELIKEADQ